MKTETKVATAADGSAAAEQTPVPEESARPLDASSGPFFRRIDWVAFGLAFVATLAVYGYTCAPTVTLEDSGELAVASDYLGVPHPPGYPIWTLLTWFFQWVFHFVDFHGHPNPAWGVAFCSAFFGALACGMLAMLISRSCADLLRGIRRFDVALGYATEAAFCLAGGVAGGLVLAFSPVMWSQAVIVEVYALNAFFQILIMLLLYRWMSRPADRQYLYAMAFFFGLGLTNHQTLMFFAVALVMGIMVRDNELFRDFFITGLGLVALVGCNVVASKLGHEDLTWFCPKGPSSPVFWIYSIMAVAIPILGGLTLPNGKTVCITFLLAELGMLFYLYLPFASEQNPPMNWGYPRTWEGFLHAISRGQYERISPTDVFSIKFADQAGLYLMDLRRQFTLPLVAAGFLPFCLWKFRVGRSEFKAVNVAMILVALIAAVVIAEIAAGWAGHSLPAALVTFYRVLTLAVMLIAGVGMMAKIVDLVLLLSRRTMDRALLTAVPYILILGGLVMAAIFVDYMLVKMVFKTKGLGALPILAILGAVVVPPVLGFGLYLMRREPIGFGFESGRGMPLWILTTAAGFLSVSLVFIALWNPALDIQTLFIGRVQFIQSHTLFALWIGYGVVLALALTDVLLGALRWLRWPAAIAAMVLPPALLLWKNGYDQELIRIYGSAEQNGHDFGWQFGDWQLRGVNGVREYLQETMPAADFEKAWAEYPDKSYPPEMSTNAVFFGGTDPGRFVPTYMIYSAKVRPDVYLITQNALADNTYLNIMRDLYGDTIWIPSVQDSNQAFQIYLQEVNSGRLGAGADIDVKDGRISVQGVQGVMHINGILARMIYDNNKARHGFYVEESYVIPWMYEFLEPHGLIMKICPEPSALSPELIKQDHDFWGWYCKRLLADSKFLRDVVARKTFSKLRSALAGLYAARAHYDEAEYAFKQAIDLYPLSPEANFRLADVFVARGRYDEARKLINDFLVGDPGNDKIREFLGYVDGVETSTRRCAELEASAGTGRMDLNQAMELLELYRRLQRWPKFDAMLQTLLRETALPPQVYMSLGKLCYETQRIPMLELALTRYLAIQPADAGVMLELGAVRAALGRADDAMSLLVSAVNVGGEQVRDVLRKDRRFDALRARPDFQHLTAIQPGSGPVGIPSNLKDLLR